MLNLLETSTTGSKRYYSKEFELQRKIKQEMVIAGGL